MGEVIDFSARAGASAKGAKKGGSGTSTTSSKSAESTRSARPATSACSTRPGVLEFLRLRITLDSTEPPVWREIIVPTTMALSDTAVAIALSFGWSAERSHMFRKGKVWYDDPRTIEDAKALEPAKTHIDATEINIGDVLKRKGSKIEYVYDTENWWQTTVELAQTKIPETDYLFDLVPVCTDGFGLNPPEDAGGVEGYYRFLDAVAEPSDPDYARLRIEAGYDLEEYIDESWFEPMAVNERYAPITAMMLMDTYATMNRTQLLDAIRGLLTENLINGTEAILALSELERLDNIAAGFSRAYYETLGVGPGDGLDDGFGGKGPAGHDFARFDFGSPDFSRSDAGATDKGAPRG